VRHLRGEEEVEIKMLTERVSPGIHLIHSWDGQASAAKKGVFFALGGVSSWPMLAKRKDNGYGQGIEKESD